MLVLGESDIEQAVDPEEIINTVESAMILYEGDDFFMPPRNHIDYKDNTYLLMPAFTSDAFGSKLVSVFPGNVAKDQAVIQGLMVLNDIETGEPLAVIDGATLTAIRTGAVGAAGVKHLSKKDSITLGVIGAGVQGFQQALFSSHVKKCTKLYLYDLDPDKSEQLAYQLNQYRPNVHLEICLTASHLVRNSEVIITATTSQTPVIPDDPKVLEGRVFIGIGSYKPTIREFPDSLFPLIDRVFIDSLQAPEEAGDLIVPIQKGLVGKGSLITIGKLIQDKSLLGTKPTKFYKSVGMALFDICVAKVLYTKALAKGLGFQVQMNG